MIIISILHFQQKNNNIISHTYLQKKNCKYNARPSAIYIQEMGNRWGSCTPKGKIILNTELIKAPKPCIEYVITHELCHLLHHDHTKAFFELLEAEMPDWKRWKNKLEKFMAQREIQRIKAANTAGFDYWEVDWRGQY